MAEKIATSAPPGSPVFRLLDGLEQQQALYVWSQSFEQGDKEMASWRRWEERTPSGRATYGMFKDGTLRASFLIVDEWAHVGADAVVPVSAVCGVGVLPADRGRGYASTGMRRTFERMRESGRHLSLLEPFSWEFYSRLGYAWTAPNRRYTAPTRLLPQSPEGARVRAAGPDDHAAIKSCYARMAVRYRGMLRRRDEAWALVLNASTTEETCAYLYEADGEVEGYLVYHSGNREETRIDELIALTPRATAGMLGLLRQLDMQTECVRWNAPVDDLLWSTFMHRDLKTELHCRLMARIVDLPAALGALRPGQERAFGMTVAVIDAFAPWNDATWRVEVGGGRVQAMPTTRDPEVTLSIQALTQAFLGSPTLCRLREAGLVDVHREPGFAALDLLLAGPPAWCCDSF